MSANQPTDEALQRELVALRARVAELEQRDAVLTAMASASPDFIVVIDADGRHLDVLQTKAPVADRAQIGRTFHELRPAAEADRYLALVRSALADGAPKQLTFSADSASQTFWLDLSVLPLGADRVLWIARDITSMKERERAQRELGVFRQIVNANTEAITMYDEQGVVTYANPAAEALFGHNESMQGVRGSELVAGSPDEIGAFWQTLLAQGSVKAELPYRRKDGSEFPAAVSITTISSDNAAPQGFAAVIRDLSEERLADEERTALQEQVIDAQRAALREVSTPLIPLADDVVVMPLVGSIDSARAQQIMEVLLEGIAHYQADTVLLDISGVRVVDTQVADALLRSARAVQLLGAQIILTGISADVAQTIVHLGADMGRIMTRANLQDGLRYALEERAH